MHRLCFLPCVLFLVLISSLSARAFNNEGNGGIRGQVISADGQPAAFVTVMLKGHRRGTGTDEQGKFYFNNLTAGHYTLQVSLVGHASAEKEVEVVQDRISEVVITIEVSGKELEQVVVHSGHNRFAKKESDEVARLPLKNLENPQVYHTAGLPLIREQVIIERTDLYRNIPGAVPNFAAGGSQGMSLRGFANNMGMRNGLITSAIVPMNPAILEKIEVLKGPSATLFGSNRNITFGGVFNYITKRPTQKAAGEVNFTAGSFGLARLAADINTPLNKEKTALFRINIAGQTENSFQYQGYAKNYTITPSFSYRINDRLQVELEAELTRSAYTTTSIAIGQPGNITARNFRDLQLDYKNAYINDGIDIHNGIQNVQARAEYKLSSSWKSQTNYLYSEGYYKSLLWTTLNMLTDSTFSRTVRNQTPETFGNIQFQQNFIGDFLIGRLRNRMVVGLDYSQNYNELYRVTLTYDTVNLRRNIPDMSNARIQALSAARAFSTSTFKSHTYSAYVSDVLNITPDLMVMLSLRADRYTTKGTFSPLTGKYTGDYDQNALSPKLGIVYQPVPGKLSVFGNYMNGFVNLAPVLQPDNTILDLKPQYGNQWEAGVKLELLNGKLNGSVSYYDIAVTNSTRVDVVNGQNFTVQDGTQRSKGFDAELIGNPLPGLNFTAGYGFNENRYDRASRALEGKYLTASPRHVGNVWVSYRLPRRGWGFGAGANYVSDSWFETTNTFVLPSYTLLSASLFYETASWRLSLKGNNLLDQQYWNSTGNPQKPVNFLVGFAFKW